MTYDSIRKEIKLQMKIEGNTPESGLLLAVLPLCKSVDDWRQLTRLVPYRYGKLSYETHRFYYPSTLLRKLERFFTEQETRL